MVSSSIVSSWTCSVTSSPVTKELNVCLVPFILLSTKLLIALAIGVVTPAVSFLNLFKTLVDISLLLKLPSRPLLTSSWIILSTFAKLSLVCLAVQLAPLAILSLIACKFSGVTVSLIVWPTVLAAPFTASTALPTPSLTLSIRVGGLPYSSPKGRPASCLPGVV